jgi:hypothetical protein
MLDGFRKMLNPSYGSYGSGTLIHVIGSEHRVISGIAARTSSLAGVGQEVTAAQAYGLGAGLIGRRAP